MLNLKYRLVIMSKKTREKEIKFSSDDEKLISVALSIIWLTTNKKIESCSFESEKVKLSFKRNEECIYFDLQESLSALSGINKVF